MRITLRNCLTIAATMIAMSATPILAQQKATPEYTIGKSSQIHLNVPVKVGTVTLPPGMYQLQHKMEGDDHYVSFRKVSMAAGYRHGNTQVAKEDVASVKCRVEATDKVRKTALTFRTNAAGEKELAEVRIAGESFKHEF